MLVIPTCSVAVPGGTTASNLTLPSGPGSTRDLPDRQHATCHLAAEPQPGARGGLDRRDANASDPSLPARRARSAARSPALAAARVAPRHFMITWTLGSVPRRTAVAAGGRTATSVSARRAFDILRNVRQMSGHCWRCGSAWLMARQYRPSGNTPASAGWGCASPGTPPSFASGPSSGGAPSVDGSGPSSGGAPSVDGSGPSRGGGSGPSVDGSGPSRGGGSGPSSGTPASQPPVPGPASRPPLSGLASTPQHGPASADP
jgi:hypothetical protein